MRLDWKTPFLYFTRDPEWKAKVLIGGLWLLVFPPLGWPIALGYRKEALFALVEGREPFLPPWKGKTLHYLAEGLKAVGVILVYFVPFIFLFWFLAVREWSTLTEHILEFIIFLAAVVLLVPLCLPLLPPLYWYLFPWIEHSPVEIVGLATVFWATTFLMPSAFLQVSLAAKFSAAFRVARVVSFVVCHPREYLEAWAVSLAATALACVLGPAAPWGIFCSYLVIVYAFNEALFLSATPEVQWRFRDSCFTRKSS